jgi:cell division topological specificity factor
MANLFDRILGRKPSANLAKERLQLVLIHDRSKLSPGVLADLRDEIIEVISRHVEIDASGVKLQMTQEGTQNRLVADIPLRESRKR